MSELINQQNDEIKTDNIILTDEKEKQESEKEENRNELKKLADAGYASARKYTIGTCAATIIDYIKCII